MHIVINGVDTNNSDLVNNLITVITQAYPEYSSMSISITENSLDITLDNGGV